MRRTFLLFLALVAVACGGKVFVDTPGATTGSGGTTGAGASPGAGGGGTCDSCHCCVCDLLVSQGGCKDICTMGENGPSTPNFCDIEGAPALTQCAKCMAQTCGQSDPSQCN